MKQNYKLIMENWRRFKKLNEQDGVDAGRKDEEEETDEETDGEAGEGGEGGEAGEETTDTATTDTPTTDTATTDTATTDTAEVSAASGKQIISRIQQLLVDAGFAPSEQASGPSAGKPFADGQFGRLTYNAMRAAHQNRKI